MGKTARWFRGLLGGGKKSSGSEGNSAGVKEKKRWGFVKSFGRDRGGSSSSAKGAEERRGEGGSSCSPAAPYIDGAVDPNKHAIAVAAATAAVAEAAVAAAQAAAAVVRLTSSGRCPSAHLGGAATLRDEDSAAVKIQAAFRAYLARRALRALKGLVRLQALVRGHLVRKHAVDILRGMEAVVRLQARARATRIQMNDGRQASKSTQQHHPCPATPEKYEAGVIPSSRRHDQSGTLQRTPSTSKMEAVDWWMDEKPWDRSGGNSGGKHGTVDDDKNDKVLEVDHQYRPRKLKFQFDPDTRIKPRLNTVVVVPDSPSKDSTTAQYSTPSSNSGVHSRTPLGLLDAEESAFCTAENSPEVSSAFSRQSSGKRGGGPSDCSRSIFGDYYPSYMANTESSKAKVRSHSAPKQRPTEFDKSASAKRVPSQNSSLQARFVGKAYHGSGRLDRFGMPIREIVTYGAGAGVAR